MAEGKTQAAEVTVTILVAASGVFAAIGIFEAQEHHNAVGWFTVCAASLIAAILIPAIVFIFLPWIKRLSERQHPVISKTGEQYESAQKTAEQDKPAQEPIKAAEERVFVNATPKYLTDFYDKFTHLEATISVERYLGKWLKIAGHLNDIRVDKTERSVWYIVHLDVEPSGLLLIFNDSKWFPRLEILKRGDRIAAIGRVGKIDLKSVSLEDCELVDEESEELREDDLSISKPKLGPQTEGLQNKATEHDRRIVADFLKALPPHSNTIIWLKEEFISKSVPVKHIDLFDQIFSEMRLNVVGLDNSDADKAYEKLRDAIGRFLELVQFDLFANSDYTALQRSPDWPWEQWKEVSGKINEARNFLVETYDEFIRTCHKGQLN